MMREVAERLLALLTSRKVLVALAGLYVTLRTAQAGHMDGNVALCVTSICGGFMGADTLITRKAIGKADAP